MVAPSREVVEPLAAVAGAERAISRAELLASPATLTRARAAAPAPIRPDPPRARPIAHRLPRWPTCPPPLRPAPPSIVPPTLAEADESPPRPSGQASAGLMSLIDEETHRGTAPPAPRERQVEVAVSLVSEHNFFVGSTRRIDSGGRLHRHRDAPARGTRIQVRLGLADGRRLDLEGEVAFLRAKSAPPDGNPPDAASGSRAFRAGPSTPSSASSRRASPSPTPRSTGGARAHPQPRSLLRRSIPACGRRPA